MKQTRRPSRTVTEPQTPTSTGPSMADDLSVPQRDPLVTPSSGGGDELVYLRRAEEVVAQSNIEAAAGNDPLWALNNGDAQGVSKDPARYSAKPNDKPDAWFNAIHVDSDQMSYVHDGKRAGIATIEQFRAQIASDLNYNDVFDQFADAAGFEKALVARYAKGGAERKEVVAHIARNLWAYGTTGADVTGRTDVGELQGLLFALDPVLAQVSESNTRHDGAFTIPGSTLQLNTHGDDDYGRASMLECRLLGAMLDDPMFGGYDESHLLIDRSASMLEDEYPKLAKILEASGIGGKVSLAGFLSGDERTEIDGGALLTPADAATVLRQAAAGGGGRRVAPLRNETNRSASESGVSVANKRLLDGKNRGWRPDSGVKRQLVIVTDESDYSSASVFGAKAQVLKDLQDRIKQTGVDVKVIYSYDPMAPAGSGAGTGREFVIVDVAKIGNTNNLFVERDGRHQLDWKKVAEAQGAVAQRWEDL